VQKTALLNFCTPPDQTGAGVQTDLTTSEKLSNFIPQVQTASSQWRIGMRLPDQTDSGSGSLYSDKHKTGKAEGQQIISVFR